MIDNGVKLYGEADAYEHACGVFLSQLKPVHKDDIAVVRRVYFSAIEAMYQRFYSTVQAYAGKPQYDQKRLSYTISALRRIKNNFRKAVTLVLSAHVWKG